jgi:putative ABC transport system ATP-binding protein
VISFMLEDQELFLSDKIVTIIISFVTEQSFCIARMVFEKRSKDLFSQKVRILLRKTRRNAMTVLEVKELTKKYGEGESEVIALDHVSFSVERGEFVAIIGASGSGKSTLMNMIGGIDYPTSGSIIIDGNEIQAMSEDELAIFRRRNLGIVYQFYNLIPTLTAEENIALPWKLDGRKENKERLSEIVNMLGLEKRAKHLPGQMSGGQQQRVSIGRALINEPAFILADEPTGNLDSKTSREILDILKFTNQKYKQTILLVTHDEKIALQANRIITIGDGKIIKDEVMK